MKHVVQLAFEYQPVVQSRAIHGRRPMMQEMQYTIMSNEGALRQKKCSSSRAAKSKITRTLKTWDLGNGSIGRHQASRAVVACRTRNAFKIGGGIGVRAVGAHYLNAHARPWNIIPETRETQKRHGVSSVCQNQVPSCTQTHTDATPKRTPGLHAGIQWFRQRHTCR